LVCVKGRKGGTAKKNRHSGVKGKISQKRGQPTMPRKEMGKLKKRRGSHREEESTSSQKAQRETVWGGGGTPNPQLKGRK